MSRIFVSILYGFLLLILSCSTPKKESLNLISQKIITKVPSASGVHYLNGSIWLIGDDAMDIFQLDEDLQIENQYQISSIRNTEEGRIIKSIKADFESMDFFDSKLLILGSGSKIISRDTAVLFDLKSREIISKINIRSLFNHLMEIGNIDTAVSINIEGFASDQNYFYLLHRGNIDGNNNVYRIQKEDFIHYIKIQEIPHVDCFTFQLPKIEGYLSGFSGACVSPDHKYLLFTSSVEATTDVYHDGEVLGSFIGYIPLEEIDSLSKLMSWPLKDDGIILKTKLESLSVIEQVEGRFKLICVSDNDNGQSGVYHIDMNIKK